ncbi:MAG: glycogen debranching protein [Firmicutes bacterium]|nr:glycogen debranching protein [Bacillota bacterium]
MLQNPQNLMDNFRSKSTKATFPKYVTASERVKLIGTINGRFPDFGHHDEREMGGLWLHPIKLLDGFWLRLHETEKINTWIIADEYEVLPWCNKFHYNVNLGHSQINITQQQFCPEEANGIYISYTFKNLKNKPFFANVEFLARTDLRPVWFASVSKNGRDYLAKEENGTFTVQAEKNDWFVKIGASQNAEKYAIGNHFGPEITDGDGLSVSLHYKIELNPNEEQTLTFFIAGSAESLADCETQYKNLAENMSTYKTTKIDRYNKILNTSRLDFDTNSEKFANFTNAYDWLKINTDWLIVNAGKHGRALSAGIPEYIWWFGCDNCYSIQGLLAIGEFALAKDTLQLILDYSMKYNGDGSFVHEINTNGDCANRGNTQETSHFMVAAWLYYEWTGDKLFLQNAFDYLTKGMDWLQQQNTGEDGFPSGYGITEIEGLNSKLIDTAVYTAVAYENYAQMCQLLQKNTENISYFVNLANKLKANINSLLWNAEEGLFCDALTNGKPQLDCNWVINVPMEMGLSDEEKAHIALKTMNTPKFIGQWGMYLSGTNHTHTMTINTAVMAAAQARYGYPDIALDLLERTFSTLDKTSPGCFAEMSPDYGCFVQAWTIYIAMVITKYLWGIQPKSTENGIEITINPNLPTEWQKLEKCQLANVPIFDGTITISHQNGNYEILSTANCPVNFKKATGEFVAIPSGKVTVCQK